MNVENEKRYRLRIGSKIVGYQRILNDKMHFYSRDSFWWTGKPLEFEIQDECLFIKDKNSKYIYEWDIVKFKIDPDGDYEDGAILWNSQELCFGIYAIRQEVFFPLKAEDLDLFDPRQMEVFSYLFINPELQEKLGLRE